MDQVTQMISATSNLLAVLIWPTLLFIVIWRLRGPIAGFVSNLGEINFKAGSVEASARRQVEAAVALGAAMAKPSGQSPGQMVDPAEVAGTLSAAVPNARSQRQLEGTRILWVDDRPENNRYERTMLEALGIKITLSTSTEDALMRISILKPDMILSDMGRPPDQQAGYTLLDALRARGDNTPFMIYASSRAPEHIKEARAHGAIGCTNSAQELILLVSHTLTSSAKVSAGH